MSRITVLRRGMRGRFEDHHFPIDPGGHGYRWQKLRYLLTAATAGLAIAR